MKTWFNITNSAASDSATIDILDEIGGFGISADQFIMALRTLKGKREIVLNVNCPGGSCEDGLTIFDALNEFEGKIVANIVGTAASMASLIILAADVRTIAENGRVMVHRVTGSMRGNPDDLDAGARLARQYEDRMVGIFMAELKMTEDKVRDMMKAQMGTWFFGKQAVEAGFAHSVKTGTKASNFHREWANKFEFLPAALFDNDSLTMKAIADEPTPAATTEAEPSKETGVIETPPAGEPGPATEGEVVTPDAPTEPEAKGFIERIVSAFSGDAAMKKELETVRASVTAKDTEIATLKAEVETLKPAADQLALIEAKLREAEANAKSVGRAAAEIAASHGLTPEKLADLPAPSGEAQGSNIIDQFNDITDPAEAQKFFKAHKAELKAALRN